TQRRRPEEIVASEPAGAVELVGRTVVGAVHAQSLLDVELEATERRLRDVATALRAQTLQVTVERSRERVGHDDAVPRARPEGELPAEAADCAAHPAHG